MVESRRHRSFNNGFEASTINTHETPAGAGGNAWEEIADASLVLEKAMNHVDTVGSEESDFMYTSTDVDCALKTIRHYSKTLGVKERDLLLMAVKSEEEQESAADGEEMAITRGSGSNFKPPQSPPASFSQELFDLFSKKMYWKGGEQQQP